VYLRENPPFQKMLTSYGYEFRVERLANKQVKVEVTRVRGSRVALQHAQNGFDFSVIENHSDFRQNLTPNLQGLLRQLYSQAAPDWIENLTTHRDLDPNTREIKCAAYPFNCGKENLFAGVVEVLYQMRCTLFHGELVPTKDAIACYEPAFRLVRRFLECVA
jgi:hypothetical protein